MVTSEGYHRSRKPGCELGQPLSMQQKRILLLKAEGFTLTQIAQFQKRARGTVNNELKIAMHKLGARNCNNAIYIYMLVRLRR